MASARRVIERNASPSCLGITPPQRRYANRLCVMKYHPEKHHRRSIRLKDYDYTQGCAYCVTICTHERECLFDDAGLRRIAEKCWLDLPRHFPNLVLDEWVVMPNHLHGIIVLGDHPRKGEAFPLASWDGGGGPAEGDAVGGQVHAGNASPLQAPAPHLEAHSLGAIVGNFKSVTARRINAARNVTGAPVWQRNYYEHIIRDNTDLSGFARTFLIILLDGIRMKKIRRTRGSVDGK